MVPVGVVPESRCDVLTVGQRAGLTGLSVVVAPWQWRGQRRRRDGHATAGRGMPGPRHGQVDGVGQQRSGRAPSRTHTAASSTVQGQEPCRRRIRRRA